MKNRLSITTLYATAAILAAACFTGCKDTLLDDWQQSGAESDGIGFSLSVTEQVDMIYNYGETRAAKTDSTLRAANRFEARTLQGNNPYGIQVHRMPLPLMGIHPRTAHGGHSVTRASTDEMIESGNPLEFHDSLTIWGYTKEKYTSVNNTQTSIIFPGTILKKIRNWRSSAHWPYDGGQMKFYAVSPAMENLDLRLSNTPGFSTAPTFTYTVPDNPDQQRDLLYGESELIENIDSRDRTLGQDDKIIPLNFRHLLTAVRFAQGKIPTNVTIKSISLYHIKEKGQYTPGSGWSDVTNSTTNGATYTVETNWASSSYAPSENTYIKDANGKDFVLFLMPHTLDGVGGPAPQLHVVLSEKTYKTDNKGDLVEPRVITEKTLEHTIVAPLTGDVWEPGHTVTYKLTIGTLKEGYYLLADDVESIDHDVNNTKGTFKLHSFQNVMDYSSDEKGVLSSAQSVAWKITGYIEQKETPAENAKWTETTPTASTHLKEIDGYDKESTGGEVTVNYAFNVLPAKYSANHKTILTTNSTTEASDVELSLYRPAAGEYIKTDYHPSNCYIVNRSGSYCFQLRYGKKSSETDSKGKTKFPDIFKDHQGNHLSAEWISKHLFATYRDVISDTETTATIDGESKTIHNEWAFVMREDLNCFRAEVIWQDAPGLVSLVGTNGIEPSWRSYDYSTKSSDPTKQDNLTEGPEGGMIRFHVNKDNITPGNAVIGLYGKRKKCVFVKKNEGDKTSWEYNHEETKKLNEYEDTEYLIWTWHIWVTDEVYPNFTDAAETDIKYPTYDATNQTRIVTLKDENGTAKGKILPVNLGWVPDAHEFNVYEPRYVWVKIEQSISGQTLTLRLTQHARQELVTGTSTIYQWGRPTALPMLKDINGKTRNLYKGVGTTPMTETELEELKVRAISNVQDFLLHPMEMVLQSGEKKWAVGADYWQKDYKSPYDPCPPGFTVPEMSIFSGFSLTGTDAEDPNLNLWPAKGNAKSGAVKKGGWFYTQAYSDLTDDDDNTKRYSPMVYMPSTGYWSGDKTQGDNIIYKFNSESTSYYWTIDRESDNAKYLQIRPESTTKDSKKAFVIFSKSYGNGYALPIRPTGDLLPAK